MKRQLIVLLLGVFIISCDSDINRYLYQDVNTKKWGYKNRSGEILLDPIYDNARQFKEGLALVRINGNNFYIDKFKRVKIDPPYDDKFSFLKSFNEGVASFKARRKSKYGYINKSGDVITKFEFGDNFKSNKIGGVVSDGGKLYFFSNKEIKKFHIVQKPLDKSGYNMAKKAGNTSKRVIIDNEGEIISTSELIEEFNEVGDGLFVKKVSKDTTVRYFICKASNGNTVSEIKGLGKGVTKVGRFSEGILSIITSHRIKFYNKDAELIFQKDYGTYNNAINGLINFSMYSKNSISKVEQEHYGYIDIEGNSIVPDKYFEASDFQNGIALVSQIVGMTNYNKEMIIEKWYIDEIGKRLFLHSKKIEKI